MTKSSTTTASTPLGFKRNGRTHVALMIAKSLRRRFTLEDLRFISPTLFRNGKLASQSLNLLIKHGFIDKNPDGWKITADGISHIYKSASTNPYAASEFSSNGY